MSDIAMSPAQASSNAARPLSSDVAGTWPWRTPTPTAWRERLALLVIALAATTPWLTKPFHLDDVLYLSIAGQIGRTPLDPYRGTVLWDAPDGQPAPVVSTDFNPPLWKYLLAAAIPFTGPSEWKLHLLQGLFTLGATFGLAAVARRFTRRPLWPVSLIILGPAFVPGQNLMLEPSMLCWTMWALDRQFRSWETGRNRHAWLAGLLLGLATLTKYTAGLMAPILLLGAVLFRRPRSAVTILPWGMLVAVWVIHNRLMYPGEAGSHLGSRIGDIVEKLSPAALTERMLAVIRIVGAISLLGPILIRPVLRRRHGAAWLIAAMGLSAVTLLWQWRVLTSLPEYGDTFLVHPLGWVHYVAFVALGTLQLGLAGALLIAPPEGASSKWGSPGSTASGPAESLPERIPEGRFRLWIGVWLVLLLVFNVTLTPFNAVRHLLLWFVPMTLLAARELDRLPGGTFLRIGVWLATVTLGTLLAAADMELARFYRDAADQLVAKETAAGRTVRFTGNWGWVSYAFSAGGWPLVDEPERFGIPPVQPGDRVVRPYLVTWREPRLSERFGLGKPVQHLNPIGVFPLRTIAPGTNYYDNARHQFPWQLLLMPARDPRGGLPVEFPALDDVMVFEIVPAPSTGNAP